MATFPNPILTITSEQELPLLRVCQYGPSKIYIILPTVLKQPIFGKPQIVLDNCLTILVISRSSPFSLLLPYAFEKLEQMNIIAHAIDPTPEAYGMRSVMSNIQT